MDRTTPCLALLSVLCVSACADDAPTPLATDTGDTGTTSTTATTSATESSATTGSTSTADTTDGEDESSSSGGEDLPPSSDWCDRLVAGPTGDAALIDLAVAHAFIRFFGAEVDYPTVDAALAGALEPADALDGLDLTTYDDALASVCIVPAAAAESIGPASVELMGTIAWVRPGTGAIVLPAEAQTVVLDLRDLPSVPELPELLAAAVAPATATAIPRPTRRVRRHTGHTDQVFTPDNVYSTDRTERVTPPIEPTGANDLELVVVTGERLPAAAAELAGALRLQSRAWLVGHDVLTEVAEASWSPIGDVGAAWRSCELLDTDDVRWPDTILADFQTNAPEAVVPELAGHGVPPPSVGDDARSSIEQYDPWAVQYANELGLGEIRSALMVAYGTLELFFPYFEVVGHETDEALLELLAEAAPADAGDRALQRERLRRFSASLHDGHAFTRDHAALSPLGVISARFEMLDGQPVVRRTNQPGLQPGDTITEIEGVPAPEWYAARHSLVSAASDGYRDDLVTRLWVRRAAPIELTIESALGVTQTLLVDPVTLATGAELGDAPVNRPSGWLDDVGAPGLYYINVATGTTPTLSVAIDAAIEGSASGMVVDMRGYPSNANHYAVAQRLIPGSFESAHFETPIRIGPDVVELEQSVYVLNEIDAYDGPMVLLVGNHSVSAAENFSIMLVGADRVTVVGQPSAATNGNISGIKLPGNFSLTFTSMRVLFPDGSTFHGVGIVPDVEVAVDPAAYALGDDPELTAAIAVLSP